MVRVTATSRENSICKKKMFIPCKPHRARAQPRSDLGRNRAVTVGIENKKQTKHFSIISTISWRNNWLNCNLHNIFFFQEPMTAIWAKKESFSIYSRWKPHANNDHFRWWWNHIRLERFSPCKKITLIPETGVRKTALNSRLPNSCKYCNIHKKKLDFSSPLLLTTRPTTNRWPLSLPA